EVKVSIDQTLESRSPRDIINTALRALMHRERTSVITPQGRAAQRNEEFAFEMQRFCLCVNVHNDRTHQVRSIPRSHQLSSGSGGCSGQLGNDGPKGSPASIDLHTMMNSPGVHVSNVCVPETESSPDSSGTIDTSVSPTLLWAQVGIKDSLGNDGPTGSLTAEDLQTPPPPTAPAAYSPRRLQHPPPC
ncbi:hypothetical protein KUCAC02_033211, partial [Chaenocephalus aceratus]